MRQIHKAGEKLFVDYAGHTLPIVNRHTGEISEAQVFVAVMGASNYAGKSSVRKRAQGFCYPLDHLADGCPEPDPEAGASHDRDSYLGSKPAQVRPSSPSGARTLGNSGDRDGSETTGTSC